MSDIAIKVENLSKLYRLGTIGTGSIASDLTRWWAGVRGKEDPFALIAIANDRSQKATSEFVWSLKDINFEIKKGDAVGIIGKNGAGKSTLLKVLSRTTSPTTGQVKINGRVASLLEVGTGFHGDLTGRENIYMNGAILGMTRSEVTSKMEEIVEFSGVAGYIDTPVKRYSSGMYVRLAFAVAAHLEPDILIIDEVLAVGDAEFQKKCLGKMQNVNSQQGRTVLFVSHQLEAIRKLCKSAILLKTGSLIEDSTDVTKTLDNYLKDQLFSIKRSHFYINDEENATESDVILLKAAVLNNENLSQQTILFGEPFSIQMKWKKRRKINATAFAIRIFDESEKLITSSNTLDTGLNIDEEGCYNINIHFPTNVLIPQIYYISFGCYVRPHSTLQEYDRIISFEISEISYTNHFVYNLSGKPSLVMPNQWTLLNY